MSSQDVIELGSSEDESEKSRVPRAVAKQPQKRPILNAMVHIPTGRVGKSKAPIIGIPKITNITGSTKIGAVTVKSNKNLGIINGSNLPNVTIKPLKRLSSVPTCIPISANKVRNPLSKNAYGQTSVSANHNKTPLHVSNKVLNCPRPGLIKIRPGAVNAQSPSLSNIMQNLNPQVKKVIESKMTPQQKLALQQKKTPHKSTFKLPPGITVKNISKNSTQPSPLKRSATATKPTVVPKKVRRQRPQPITVATVELDADDDDDDQTEPSSSAPQWYVRPEDNIKKQNENEPEPQKIFEITIEDSPIKPIQNKRACEVEKEISISIEDSPVKPPEENVKDTRADHNSDEETPKTPKTPSSRKKLNYPNETQPHGFNEKTIEIEIEPYTCDPFADHVVETGQEEKEHLVIEIQESPIRKKRKLSPDVTPKKIRSAIVDKPAITDKPASAVKPAITDKPASAVKPVIVEKPAIADKQADKVNKSISILNDEENKDFHSVYKSFIELCFKLDDTEDMKTIVEKKIKAYYLQVPKDYRDSEEFIELVTGKMDLMKASPDLMFLYIKDVVDELNIQRKLARMPNHGKQKEKEEPPIDFDDSEKDVKRRRQIKKLEKTLKKLHRAIYKLEEQEVDFDDDGDSVYILTERYKERLIRVHAKLCQLSNVKMPSEPRVSLDSRPGQPAGPAKRLEKWINRRVPIGTPLPFPDFHDVLRCVKEANKEDNLGWNDVDVMEEARDLFTRCGKKLQRRRQENEWRVAASRITAEVDPAELSDELKRKLDDNRRAALSKETDLINKYADRQKQLQLEAVEIGDQEAEESPVESEDENHDDGDDDAKLDNRQERKERLKRLLKEKKNDNENKDAPDTENNKEMNKDAQDAEVVLSDLPTRMSPHEDDEVSKVESNKNNKTIQVKSKDTSNKERDVDVIETKKIAYKEISDIVKKAFKENKDNSVKTKDRQQSVETLSDDSQKIDSDIDELHLLQKLHSDEINSLESSDIESLIAISDSMDSGDDKVKKISSDVVSIENSSSESDQYDQVDDQDKVEEIQDKLNTEEKEEEMTVEIDFSDEKKSTADSPIQRVENEYRKSYLGPVLLGEFSSDDQIKEDDDFSIGGALFEESNESSNQDENSCDKLDNKQLNEAENSCCNGQKYSKINTSESEVSKAKDTKPLNICTDSPIDCDSESNEGRSNDKTESSEAVMIPFENDLNSAKDTLVEELNESTNQNEYSRSGSDKIDNKQLNEVENPAVNCQNDMKISTDSPIECDSESNEGRSNGKTESSEAVMINFQKDEHFVNYTLVKEAYKSTNEEDPKQDIIRKMHEFNEIESDSVIRPTEKECTTKKESNQPEIRADSPINCDSNSKSNDKTETSETLEITFETDTTSVHDEVKSAAAMDVDIVNKEIEDEIPEKEINISSKTHTSDDDNIANTDIQVSNKEMEVDVNSKPIEVEIVDKETHNQVVCSKEK